MRRHFPPLRRSSAEEAADARPGFRIVSAESLRTLFAACCESAFTVELGVADPPIVDYMSRLLMRFVHVRSTRTPDGTLVTTFAGLLREAEQRTGRARRQLHQRIGDLSLFWTGVYPEALPEVQALDSPDAFIDLPSFGRRSYELAAATKSGAAEDAAPAPLLWRLAEEYETCRDGLRIARRTWEEIAAA